MKIFNWVHRKFHHSASKDDGLARDVKKEVESQTLLRQISLEVGLLDAAILTIGTLGLDPSKLPSCHHHCPVPYEQRTDPEEDYSSSAAADDGDDDNDESEVNPLVFSALKHHDEFDFHVMMSPENNEDESGTATAGQHIMSVDGVSLVPEITTADDPKKMTGSRTTLADLFLADSNHVRISNLSSVQTSGRKKHDSSTKRQAAPAAGQNKNGIFSAKKLIPHVGQKSHPVKKLNQMMKKMMKRKIHPELHQGACKNMDEMEHEAIEETAYLLPIPA